jgi:signal transduction histidine kinase
VSEENLRLLLIDDDPEDRALARLVLQHESGGRLEVEEIADPIAFAQACGRRDFALVVVEQKLRWAEGLAVLGALKEDWPEVPVIMFTRFGSEEVCLQAMRLGVDNYLVKRSANFLRLPLAVQSALDQARARQGPNRRTSRASRTSRLETLLGEARVGVFSAAPDGRLLNASPELLELLGVESLEEAARLGCVAALISGAAAGGGAAPGREVEIARADGERLWVQVIATVVQDAEGHSRVDGLVEDITPRRQAQEEMARRATDLARSNEDLTRFAATASHELQEPARMVARYAQALREDCAGRIDPDADEMLGFLTAAAHRLETQIGDLMTFSRLESRARPFEPVETEDLLDHALANLRAAIEESGAEVTHSLLPPIEADPGQITLLLQNLLGNALKFRGQAPPRVHVSAARANGDWVFSVHDNGIGIEPTQLESVFAMFKRLRPDIPGSGIGLAIARRVVERHGGRIWAKSEPGHGSTFYFTVPRSGPRSGQGSPAVGDK